MQQYTGPGVVTAVTFGRVSVSDDTATVLAHVWILNFVAITFLIVRK